MSLMMAMVPDIMIMVIILIEKVLDPLEGHLEGMILQEKILPFLEGIHHLVTTLVGDMIPGDIMDIHLVFLDSQEVMGDLLLDLLEIQEEEFHSIFLILTPDQNHHHFSNSLA